MKAEGQGTTLALLGIFLLGLAVWCAFLRGWAYDAKATLTGVAGISYLLIGVLAVASDSVPQLLRRAIYGVPLASLGLFVALQSANVLAFGQPTLDGHTATRSLWVTLLGYPVGLGYIYGRSTTTGLRRGVLLAASSSVLAGSVIGSVVWVDIWPVSIGMRFLLLSLIASGIVLLGALPAYLIPTQFTRTTTA